MPAAIRLGKIEELSAGINAPVIPCDVSNETEVNDLIDKSKIYFGGGFDFILHSIGMSMNIRKKKAYTETDYDHYLKTLDVSALSLHKILQACYRKDALNEHASVVALTYIASQRVFPNYNDMTEAKAALESIVRNFGYYYGRHKKVRINSVSQSPTLTSAAQNIEGFEEFRQNADDRSPLGNATAQDCAKFICALFSDYTQKITMQNIYHDGGFSSTGI
jgi:enoyl-[acyl-carrier protein] reductase I